MNILSANATIYWLDVLLSMSIRKNHFFHSNTTLNEYLDIDRTLLTEDFDYPILNYYAIGTGGEPIIDNINYRYNDHSATDIVLRNMIPFVLRPSNNDLTSLEKEQYRFRKSVIINEEVYFAYYLKKIEVINSRDEFFKITTDEAGVPVLSIFNTKDEKLLSPTALEKKALIENNKTTQIITKTIQFLFNLSISELEDIQNVLTLLKLDNTHITEIAICSSIDKETYSEPRKVQIAYFAEAAINIATKILSEKPLNMYLEVGSSEPYI